MDEAKAGLPLPDSLWASTAPPAPLTPRLQQSVVTDVAIVGAGFTGLSAALHLAEQGASVCVLDANELGWGASGRNGGQVIPLLKYEPGQIERLLGVHQGGLLNEAVQSSADLVFELIARHQISCDAIRSGWIQLANTRSQVRVLHARAEQWRRRGVSAEPLDRDTVTGRMGSAAFEGGWLHPGAGAIQPLAFTRGLVRSAQSMGVKIHGNSKVTRMVSGHDHWNLAMADGATVRANRVLVATNGYTDGIWPGLRHSILAANSFVIATEPLTPAAAHSILPGREVASTAQRLLLYFRRDAHGHLLLGGRGQFADPRGPGDFGHLERSLCRIFPQLREVAIKYRWSGRIAVTRDSLPHVHEPAPGVLVALGYNGRGIATGTMLGKHLAARMCGKGDFPLPITPVRTIPLHRLQRLYVAAGIAWYGLLDRLT